MTSGSFFATVGVPPALEGLNGSRVTATLPAGAQPCGLPRRTQGAPGPRGPRRATHPALTRPAAARAVALHDALVAASRHALAQPRGSARRWTWPAPCNLLVAGGRSEAGTRNAGATDPFTQRKENTMNRKHYTLIGAAVGLATFLALGLLPALLYGGYAGVLLAGGIFGTPLQATFLVRGLIVFGMVLGVVGVGALFAVGGAVAGAAVSMLTGAAPEHEAKAASRA